MQRDVSYITVITAETLFQSIFLNTSSHTLPQILLQNDCVTWMLWVLKNDENKMALDLVNH